MGGPDLEAATCYTLTMRHLFLCAAALCASQWSACNPEPRSAAAQGPVALPDGVEDSEQAAKRHRTFGSYWYRGKAELNRYKLRQSRYGEVHEGEAMLIFVTEDFDRERQVKFEGAGDRRNAVRVLKLNATRRFYTGVYPYTLMTSSFTPVQQPLETLKVTFSAHDWCGQTFTQLNRRGGELQLKGYSYFESEGDEQASMQGVPTEDGLLARLRTNPQSLPVGELRIVPGLHHMRLRHRPLAPQRATASLGTSEGNVGVYTLRYEDGRVLRVRFEQTFPHRVLGWSEQPAGLPATTAKLERSLLMPYWNKARVADGVYREALGL